MTTATLPTRNTEWGFCGTLRHHADADEAWPLAMAAIAETTGCDAEAVRDFLDSRDGRHFADDVANGLHRGQHPAAATDASPEGVRDFLDSRHGRHFADDVANALHAGHALAAAIEHAVARWQSWRIGRQTSRDTGIPAGLPYLTGFVTRFLILDEIDAEV